MSYSGLGLRVGRPRHEPLDSVRRALDKRLHVRGGLREASQHVARHDLRVGRVRPADAHAHTLEVRPAQLALQGLEPVVPGQAAAEPRADIAERQVDFVVHHHDAVEVDAQGTARRSRGTAGVVHEGLRHQHAHARAAGEGAPVGEQARILLLGPAELPALDQLLGDFEADVVAGAGVAVARIAEPYDQPVDTSRGSVAAKEAQDSWPESPPEASSAVAPSA